FQSNKIRQERVAAPDTGGARSFGGSRLLIEFIQDRERKIVRVCAERLGREFPSLRLIFGVNASRREFPQREQAAPADHLIRSFCNWSNDADYLSLGIADRRVRKRVVGFFGIAVALEK